MAEKRRALGRGLGALIPSAPTRADPAARSMCSSRSRSRARGGVTATPPHGAPTASLRRSLRASPRAGRPNRDRPHAGARRTVRRDRPRARSAPIRSSRGPSSTRTTWLSSSTRSARSGCSSRSSCAGSPLTRSPTPTASSTSSSWGSAAGGRPRRPSLATIPAIIKDTNDDALLRDALLENLHRSQLNPLEEAAAYQQLLDDFGCSTKSSPSASVAPVHRSPTRSAS